MSKSRFSKTKAAGLLCGMSRCKDYKFSQTRAGVAQAVATRGGKVRDEYLKFAELIEIYFGIKKEERESE